LCRAKTGEAKMTGTESANKSADKNDDWACFPGITGLDRILHLHEKKDGEKFTVDEDYHKIWKLPKFEKHSCNIVISGKAGTGKSTLALHMAAALRIKKSESNDLENATVLYYNLEQSAESLIEKGHNFSPEACLKIGPKNTPSSFDEIVIKPERLEKIEKIKELEKELEELEKIEGFEDFDGIKGSRELEKLEELGILEKDIETIEGFKKFKVEGFKKFKMLEEFKRFKKLKCDSNLVLFPALSPRILEQIDDQDEKPSVFWRRLDEIKNLIDSIKEKNEVPRLRMVVIDSLNAFGNKAITRYLIDRFFNTLNQYNLIALFIVEDSEQATSPNSSEAFVASGITYLADTVIKLDWDIPEGYAHRTLNIIKSRHVANAYGDQYMKIRSSGITIYPSLHQWHNYLRQVEPIKCTKNRKRIFEFNDPTLSQGFDKCLYGDMPRDANIIQVLSGPRGTLKGDLAIRYAINSKTDEITDGGKSYSGHCLLVSFEINSNPCDWICNNDEYGIKAPDDKKIRAALSYKKVTFKKLTSNKIKKDGKAVDKINKDDKYIEIGCQLWSVPGFLVAQELIYFIYETLKYCKEELDNEKHRITRIIFRDIGQMLSRHPYIRKQMKEYLPFFTVLLDICNIFAADCMFVCGTNTNEARDFFNDTLSGLAHFTYETKINTMPEKLALSPRNIPLMVNGHFAKKSKGTWWINQNDKTRPFIKKH
jgi:KaiC/GvpD/RAD55 family RecA-like ATPase